MGTVMAVVSGKGGTGKTTFTANVGLALADMGHPTLVIDCDFTLRNLDLVLGLSEYAAMDFSDVLAGRCSLGAAIIPHRRCPNLHLLCAPMVPEDTRFPLQHMKAMADAVRREYDFCLIDAPAGLGHGFQLATAMADRAVVITTMDPPALRDAQRTVMALQDFPAGKVHLVVNHLQKKMLRALQNTVDDAIDAAGVPLLGVIPEDSDVRLCTGRGITMRGYNKYAQRAFENIARRIAGKQVPLLTLRNK